MASRDEKSCPLFGLIVIALMVRLVTCMFLSVEDQDVVTRVTAGSPDEDYGGIPEGGTLEYYDIETQDSQKSDPSEITENENLLSTFISDEKENLLHFPNAGPMEAENQKPDAIEETESKSTIKDNDTQLLPGIHVPKYMMDLYNNFKPQTWMHSDTVRSYSNINGDHYESPRAFAKYLENRQGRKTRVHTLTFNIAALKKDENLDGAELRIHTLIARDRNSFMGVDRLVTVFLVADAQGGDQERQILDSEHVYEKSNAYETFNVTSAVVFWLSHPMSEQLVEIRIESIFSSVGDQGTMDISTNPYVETEPLLLVYSSNNKFGPNGETSRNAASASAHKLSKRSIDTEEEEEESNVIAEEIGKTRNKRKRHRNPCRRRPLFVNFADINYDTWIIAPRGYEAYECSGKCYFPLSDHLTPSQHAIVQTLLHTLTPKKAPRACCVPTKLDSISILYLDADGVVTYKYRHEDMVVVECGCR